VFAKFTVPDGTSDGGVEAMEDELDELSAQQGSELRENWAQRFLHGLSTLQRENHGGKRLHPVVLLDGALITASDHEEKE